MTTAIKTRQAIVSRRFTCTSRQLQSLQKQANKLGLSIDKYISVSDNNKPDSLRIDSLYDGFYMDGRYIQNGLAIRLDYEYAKQWLADYAAAQG